SISDIVYGTHPGDGYNDRTLRGLIHQLRDGEVRNLTIDGEAAATGTDIGFVAGIAVYAYNRTFTGNSVIRADLRAPGAETVAGIVAQFEGGTSTDNWVQATIVANKMPGGVVALARNGSRIQNNLVDVDLTMIS